MHLLIPFAAPLAEAGRQAAAALVLPQVRALLAALHEVERDTAEPSSLSPPHERARARAIGWPSADGSLPGAALEARARGLATADRAWGLITPAHWHLGTEQVSLVDPAALALDEATSRQFFDAVHHLFDSEGYGLYYAAPLRWYLSHASLDGLATASPDRVIGRPVDAWLGHDPRARRVRRLQSEVQMLLHTHPVNEHREAAGHLAVNSFWLSGCGVLQPTPGAEPEIDDRLRAPALAEDWPAWSSAWAALDTGPLAAGLARLRRGEPWRLTLCGERAWVAFEPARVGLMRRWRTRWSPPHLPTLLEGL
jgi:hypothetical protein